MSWSGSGNAPFRRRVNSGERLLGTVVASGDIALAEMVAARFDFLWIDLEHSALTVPDVQALCIAARASSCPTLVRVAEPSSSLTTALLDIGVDGLVAPRVEDPAVAAAFAAELRYPPHGSRGFAHRRASTFGLGGDSSTAPDLAPVALVQIESALAVRRAGEIAAAPGVDGLIVGPSDLAFDLGLEPGLTSPELLDAIDAVDAAAAAAGVQWGIAAGGDPQAVVRALGTRCSLLAYSADVRIYAQAIDHAAAAMREAWRASDPLPAGRAEA